MALTMTKEEREAFLADVHIGIIGLAEEGRAPLTVPIWYAYEPGGLVSIHIGRTSRKAALIEKHGRFSLCAQTETPPYKYVSVEGPVEATDSPGDEEERRALAHRYLGPDVGDMYIASTKDDAADGIMVRMRPQRWLTVDYAKQFA